MHKITAIYVMMSICLLLSACTQPYSAPTPTPVPVSLFVSPFPNNSSETPASTAQNAQSVIPNWGALPDDSVYPTPLVNMVGSNQQKFMLVEDYRGRHVVETESIPVNNCSGQDVVRVSVARSKTYSSSIELGVEATIGIDEIVKVALATQYNINVGESKSYEVNVEFSASPTTNTIYTIEWVETWIVGRVFSVDDLNNGRMNPIQYFAKSELQVNIPDSIVQNCLP